MDIGYKREHICQVFILAVGLTEVARHPQVQNQRDFHDLRKAALCKKSFS